MTFTITEKKDCQGRVNHTAHEELTQKWVASSPVESKLENVLRDHFPHCTIRRVK